MERQIIITSFYRYIHTYIQTYAMNVNTKSSIQIARVGSLRTPLKLVVVDSVYLFPLLFILSHGCWEKN